MADTFHDVEAESASDEYPADWRYRAIWWRLAAMTPLTIAASAVGSHFVNQRQDLSPDMRRRLSKMLWYIGIRFAVVWFIALGGLAWFTQSGGHQSSRPATSAAGDNGLHGIPNSIPPSQLPNVQPHRKLDLPAESPDPQRFGAGVQLAFQYQTKAFCELDVAYLDYSLTKESRAYHDDEVAIMTGQAGPLCDRYRSAQLQVARVDKGISGKLPVGVELVSQAGHSDLYQWLMVYRNGYWLVDSIITPTLAPSQFDVVIYLDPNASQDQIDAMAKTLAEDPRAEGNVFWPSAATTADLKQSTGQPADPQPSQFRIMLRLGADKQGFIRDYQAKPTVVQISGSSN